MAQEVDAATATMIKNLEEKTGKPLDQWLAVARSSGIEKHGELVKHLKADHGLTHGYAHLVALYSRGYGEDSGEELVAAQYSGDKSGLRPIYEAIVAAVRTFGADVEIAPKKTSVSLRRSKQFALVQPSTRTRVDLGIQLKGVEPHGKLEASGSVSSMVSHRIRLESAAEVDDEVVGWLRRAYESA